MLKLYHGSNVVIDKIDLCLSRKGKDFGCGFYLNPIESQAMEMAVRTTQRLQEGTPVVIGPIADDTVGLQMRRFIQGYISIDRMIEELRFKKPAVQYFFGTEKAVSYLKKI